MRTGPFVALVMLAMVACTGAGPQPTATSQPSPTTQPTAQPTASAPATPTPEPTLPPRTPPPTMPPEPTVTPTAQPTGSLTLTILPAEEPWELRAAIPGQRVCFAVQAENHGPGEVVMDYTLTGATVYGSDAGATAAADVPLPAGVVVDVCLAPDPTEVEATASVTMTARVVGAPEAAEWTEMRTLPVWPETDGRAAEQQPYFDRWVAWLSESHPELGITAGTQWDPSFVSTLLVVSHYAYWNEDWEMVIAWHVMVPPYDWTDVFLRRRGEEMGYSLGFRQDSFAGETEPHATDPPTELIR